MSQFSTRRKKKDKPVIGRLRVHPYREKLWPWAWKCKPSACSLWQHFKTPVTVLLHADCPAGKFKRCDYDCSGLWTKFQRFNGQKYKLVKLDREPELQMTLCDSETTASVILGAKFVTWWPSDLCDSYWATLDCISACPIKKSMSYLHQHLEFFIW